MWEMIERVLSQYGFNAALVLMTGFMCYKLIVWVMKSSEKREESFRIIIEQQTNALREHTEQARDFHNEVKTAHEFQRQEHERILSNHHQVCNELGKHSEALSNITKFSEKLLEKVCGR